MNIKFAIATNKDYVGKVLMKCVNSLKQSGVPKEDIYVFEGGSHDNFELYDEYDVPGLAGKYRHYCITEDAMDYNAFIGVLKWDLKADYWFMLHDTCTVGKDFYEAIKGLKIDSPVIALCNQGLSMNIGLYSTEYLKLNENFIKSFGTWKDKGELKKHMVATEDALLNNYKAKSYMCKNPPIITGPQDVYNTGTPRITVYYKEIDLYKTKANWEPKEKYELNL